MSGSLVILGVPEQPVFIPAEEGVTKIGGTPHWLCEAPPELAQLRCKKCNCPFALILSCDCPIDDDFDRVVYLYICPKCGQDGRCWRQKKSFVDGQAEAPAAPVPAPAPEEQQDKAVARTPEDLMAAISSMKIPQKQQRGKKAKKPKRQKEIGRWPAYYIETFEEPEAEVEPDVNYVMSTSAGSTNSMFEEDQLEVRVEPELVEYNERISRCPHQVIRYARFGEPLLMEKMAFEVPACPKCGAPRVFELELLPTVIYQLDPDSSMDFGPILIFSCSQDCGNGTCEEYCFFCPP